MIDGSGAERFEADVAIAEGLPLEALHSGVDIQWESFSENLLVLDKLPKGIDCAIAFTSIRCRAMSVIPSSIPHTRGHTWSIQVYDRQAAERIFR